METVEIIHPTQHPTDSQGRWYAIPRGTLKDVLGDTPFSHTSPSRKRSLPQEVREKVAKSLGRMFRALKRIGLTDPEDNQPIEIGIYRDTEGTYKVYVYSQEWRSRIQRVLHIDRLSTIVVIGEEDDTRARKVASIGTKKKPETDKERRSVALIGNERAKIRALMETEVGEIIGPLHEEDDPEQERWLDLEFLPGETLFRFVVRAIGKADKLLAEDPPKKEKAARELSSVCQGFAQLAKHINAIHQEGVIVRDAKMSNTMMPGPNIEDMKIIDFGVSSFEGEDLFKKPGGVLSYMIAEKIDKYIEKNRTTDLCDIFIGFLYAYFTILEAVSDDNREIYVKGEVVGQDEPKDLFSAEKGKQILGKIKEESGLTRVQELTDLLDNFVEALDTEEDMSDKLVSMLEAMAKDPEEFFPALAA